MSFTKSTRLRPCKQRRACEAAASSLIPSTRKGVLAQCFLLNSLTSEIWHRLSISSSKAKARITCKELLKYTNRSKEKPLCFPKTQIHQAKRREKHTLNNFNLPKARRQSLLKSTKKQNKTPVIQSRSGSKCPQRNPHRQRSVSHQPEVKTKFPPVNRNKLMSCSKEFKNWKIRSKGNRVSWNHLKIRVVCTPTLVHFLLTKRSRQGACLKIQTGKVRVTPELAMELGFHQEQLMAKRAWKSKRCMDTDLKVQTFAKCYSKPKLNQSLATAQLEQETPRTEPNLCPHQPTVASWKLVRKGAATFSFQAPTLLFPLPTKHLPWPNGMKLKLPVLRQDEAANNSKDRVSKNPIW